MTMSKFSQRELNCVVQTIPYSYNNMWFNFINKELASIITKYARENIFDEAEFFSLKEYGN